MANAGRPTDYDPKYIELVDDYLRENQDSYEEYLSSANTETGFEKYERQIKVKLPTIEGFAKYISKNKTTLYEWSDKHPLFSNALEKIRFEQRERLVNSGLSGEYNSTIAKLILSSNHGMVEKSHVKNEGGVKLEITQDHAEKVLKAAHDSE